MYMQDICVSNLVKCHLKNDYDLICIQQTEIRKFYKVYQAINETLMSYRGCLVCLRLCQ